MQKPELELIIETIPDAVIIIDISGNIIYANRAAELILGLNRSEIKKRTYNARSWKITTSEGKPFPKDDLPFSQVTKSKKPVYRVVLAIEKPDGTRIILSINATPLLDENGNIKSVISSFIDITEQREIAEEINESRRQVLDILESITDAFYALDNDWRFTYVNHKAEELFGIRKEQLLFRNAWEIMRKEQSPEIYEKYHQAKERLAPVVFEDYSSRLKKWLEMHVYPYANGVSVYIRDVTDRKQVEQARATNLHFFESMDRVNRAIVGANDLDQMMSDVLGQVLLIFDCDRAFLIYPCDPNAPAWTAPMEVTKPEYPGALSAGAMMPIDQGVAETIRILLNSNGPVRFGPGSKYPLPEYAMKKFNYKSYLGMATYPRVGKPWQFGIHQSSYARVWTDEELKLFNEIGRRITDGLTSLLIHRELQESEQKYHELFERSFDGIYITSPEGRILDANNRVAEIYGYDSKEEVLDLDLTRDVYANPVDRKRVLEKVNRDGSGEFDIPVKNKSGGIIIVHISLIAVRDENGNITSYWGLVRDVTAQKKVEEKIEQQLGELQYLQNSLLEREKQVQDLKQEVNRLSKKQGESARYRSL